MKATDVADASAEETVANPRAEAILPPLKALLAHFRRQGWVVVFANDAHEPGDAELALWGEHAMAGTPGARVVPELAPWPGPLELIVPKRAYGSFDGTDLDERLRELSVDEVVLTGQHTHICIRHTAYGALLRGYRIFVLRDAVCAFEGVNEDEELEYLRTAYGVHLTTVGELVGHPVVTVTAGLGADYDSGDVLEHEP